MLLTILIISNDAHLKQSLQLAWSDQPYQVLTADSGLEAMESLREENIDLVLLDVESPDISRFDLCRTIRTASKVPIIVLYPTDSEQDLVLALESGADDFVTKPFSVQELTARIRALLRRSSNFAGWNAKVLRGADLEIDLENCEVRKGHRTLEMTPTEFKVLRYLLENAGKLLTREMIINRVWGHDYVGDVRVVDATIHRLREKIEDNTRDPQWIITVWGFGYKFSHGLMDADIKHPGEDQNLSYKGSSDVRKMVRK